MWAPRQRFTPEPEEAVTLDEVQAEKERRIRIYRRRAARGLPIFFA